MTQDKDILNIQINNLVNDIMSDAGMLTVLQDKLDKVLSDVPDSQYEKIRQEKWQFFQTVFRESLKNNLIEECMAGTILTDNFVIKIEQNDLTIEIMKYNLDDKKLDANTYRVILVSYYPNQHPNRQTGGGGGTL